MRHHAAGQPRAAMSLHYQSTYWLPEAEVLRKVTFEGSPPIWPMLRPAR